MSPNTGAVRAHNSVQPLRRSCSAAKAFVLAKARSRMPTSRSIRSVSAQLPARRDQSSVMPRKVVRKSPVNVSASYSAVICPFACPAAMSARSLHMAGRSCSENSALSGLMEEISLLRSIP